MAGNNQFKAEDFIKAIPGTRGIVDQIARRVGCDWHTAKKYIDTYPQILEIYQEETGGQKGRAKPRKLAKYVYLVRDSLMGMTKIGHTSDLQRRMYDLQTGCPQKLELIGYIETKHPGRLEQELHNRFSHKKCQGEWFSLSDDDIFLILEYHNASVSFKKFVDNELQFSFSLGGSS